MESDRFESFGDLANSELYDDEAGYADLCQWMESKKRFSDEGRLHLAYIEQKRNGLELFTCLDKQLLRFQHVKTTGRLLIAF